MTRSKTRRVAYWIFTLLFLLPMAGSGIPELFVGGPAATAATMIHLGYPLYLMRILGFAKLLGAAAILTRRSRRLMEWAYAGYTFDLLGATVSHLVVGDGAFALVPMTMLVFVLASLHLRLTIDGETSATSKTTT